MNKRAISNSIRIIGGKWRGRRLPVVNSEGLRPSTDRVRETLFNWLMHDLPGAHCLDLFAGTGGLGLEALSRGAQSVHFVDSSRKAVAQLQNSATTLQIADDAISIVHQDARRFLSQFPANRFDIVFLDPPFATDLLPDVIALLDQDDRLHKQARIYIEQPKRADPVDVPASWGLHRQGETGQSRYGLYCLEPD